MSYFIPKIKSFFDPNTWTFTYVVYQESGQDCVIIDSVLDFDYKSGRTSTDSADRLIEFINQMNLKVQWILETHAHADHLSAAPYLKKHLGGKIAIGEHIQGVQQVFKDIFHFDKQFPTDGSQFDYLIQSDEHLPFGKNTIQCLTVPGHTPACMAYMIGDSIFVGDTLFMPDVGTARCDFPGGDAHLLFQSVKKILSFPNETRLFMCHDYPPNNRDVCGESTVSQQRQNNIHVHDGISEADFVAMRKARDATLEMPVLILPAVQVNMRAGSFPPQEENGVSYLKIPLNLL
jgi:glyoxylase-like metal-dependent hydrolase (beta-lactamase superfamily II)